MGNRSHFNKKKIGAKGSDILKYPSWVLQKVQSLNPKGNPQ